MARTITHAALIAGLAAGPGWSRPTTQASSPVEAAASAEAEPAHHARPRLIARSVSVAPGAMVDLAVTFEIDEGWHLYWNGRSDSGFPPTITLTLPEGFVAGEPLWPAPKRYELPGGILDHIYEQRVTIIIPVRAPEGVQAGSTVKFAAKLDWMECEQVCLLADGEVSLELPVAAGAGAESGDAKLFAEALARVPVPLPKRVDGVSFSWEGNVLRVEAPGAGYLAFYPALEGRQMVNPGADGESEKGILSLRFAPSGSGAGQSAQGVLEVRRTSGAPEFYSVHLAPGQAGGAPQPGGGPAGIR
jgi:DsbC/DsbD-like thiol-disulfide interchange protein